MLSSVNDDKTYVT